MKTRQGNSRPNGKFKRDALREWEVAGLEGRTVIFESIGRIRFQGDERGVLVDAIIKEC